MGLKFSIITVCYNEEKKIQSTIESVLCQNWQNYEYIIVDGKSSDSTIEIVQKYAEKEDRIRWYSEIDNGIYNAMNKGIRYAKGDFLYFLNAGDVLYSSEVLKKVASKIEESKADIVFGDRIRLESGKVNCSSYSAGEQLLKDLKSIKNVCHQVIFASKESLRDGFDEQFKICADYDWLCRQVNAGFKTAKVDLVIVNFDVCGITSKSQYKKLGLKELLTVVRKNFPDVEIWKYDEVENLLLKNSKNYMMYRCMNRWLLLKQKGVDISSFFTMQGIFSIAIYGIHYMGQRLHDELKVSPVKIKYAIDRNPNIQNIGIRVIHPDNDLEMVDAVVVTPLFDFIEIRDDLLRKLQCRIISIEEILFYEYYGKVYDENNSNKGRFKENLIG